MRSRVLIVLASIGALASAFAIDACSLDDAAPANDTDAGAEDAGRREVVYPDAEPSCDPSADILANVKDAAIADGASSTGICTACMHAKCSEQLAACAADCVCQGIMGDAIECYLTTQELACLGKLTNYLVTQETRGRALTLGGCARTDCASECAVDGGAPSDASSSTDASDASTD